MRLGIDDVMPFGKYKDTKIHELILTNPSYLLWMREHHLEDKNKRMFDAVVNGLLDEAIRSDASLRRHYKVWNFEPVEFQDAIKRGVEMREREKQVNEVRSQAYQEWGGW